MWEELIVETVKIISFFFIVFFFFEKKVSMN